MKARDRNAGVAKLPELDSLLIVVPAFNEGEMIRGVVSDCLRFAPHVLVVDDGSVDATGELAAGAGAKVVRLECRSGLGAALGRGFRYAKAKGFSHVATLDGDGAHDPQWIPRLLTHHLATKADLTIGSRFKSGRLASDVPTGKRVANFFATSLVNMIIGRELTDVASGMRMLGRRAIALDFSSLGFGIAYELIHAASSRGLHIEERPIRVRYDAQELLCTKREELLDLLQFAMEARQLSARKINDLDWLRVAICDFELVRIMIAGRYIAMVPIREYGMYAFQEQSSWFVRGHRGSEWRRISDG